MNKHLIELFKENNTVIIPGFGALSLTNRAKGEYMFMSYLKHNDGLLKNQIASSEGISTDEAQSKIEAFVTDLNSQLKSEQKAELIGLGAFFLDKSGEVDFESNAGDEPAAVIEPAEIVEPTVEELVEEKPEVVEEVIKIEDEKPVIVEEIKEETAESIPEVEEPIVAVEEPIEEVIPSAIERQDKKVEQESENPEEVTAAIPLVAVASTTIENADSQVYSEQQQWEDDLDIPPIDAKIERPKKPIVEKAKFDKKKRGAGFYIGIGAAAVLIGLAVPTVIFFDDIKANLFGEKVKGLSEMASAGQFEFEEGGKEDQDHYVDQMEEDLADSLSAGDEKSEEIVPEPAEVSTPEPPAKIETNMNPNGSFQLIVGSFQNESYANNFEKKMRAEGNTNANVFGPVGGFYLVSIGAYNSMQEAKSALAEKISTYPKIWIYGK